MRNSFSVIAPVLVSGIGSIFSGLRQFKVSADYMYILCELHVYDETPNLVNFVPMSVTELYLQQTTQVSC